MKNYTLFLIRHGITQGNLDGKYIGSTDLPLCDEGWAAISQLKGLEIYPNVGKIYSSPQKRCLETAEIIYPNRYVKQIEDFSECAFGEFEEKTQKELENVPEYAEWLGGGLDACPPGGETNGHFTLRVINGLGEIFDDMMKENVTAAAAITSSGVIMNLLANFGLPKGKPADYACKQGEGFAINLSAFLWQKGPTFEIIGRIM